jgi:hypothetical protein
MSIYRNYIIYKVVYVTIFYNAEYITSLREVREVLWEFMQPYRVGADAYMCHEAPA